MFKICSDLSKTGLKSYYFCQHSKKAKKMAKWPNHFISGKQFQKRPNGNPDLSIFCPYQFRDILKIVIFDPECESVNRIDPEMSRLVGSLKEI